MEARAGRHGLAAHDTGRVDGDVRRWRRNAGRNQGDTRGGCVRRPPAQQRLGHGVIVIVVMIIVRLGHCPGVSRRHVFRDIVERSDVHVPEGEEPGCARQQQDRTPRGGTPGRDGPSPEHVSDDVEAPPGEISAHLPPRPAVRLGRGYRQETQGPAPGSNRVSRTNGTRYQFNAPNDKEAHGGPQRSTNDKSPPPKGRAPSLRSDQLQTNGS